MGPGSRDPVRLGRGPGRVLPRPHPLPRLSGACVRRGAGPRSDGGAADDPGEEAGRPRLTAIDSSIHYPSGAMSRRILVCDDEADIRESLALLLRDEGYDVGVVSTGAAAVAEAAESDALLLDIKMTGQDGLETLAEIRKRGLRLPVVMISGHADIRTA